MPGLVVDSPNLQDPKNHLSSHGIWIINQKSNFMQTIQTGLMIDITLTKGTFVSTKIDVMFLLTG